jgi:hypothetical protein
VRPGSGGVLFGSAEPNPRSPLMFEDQKVELLPARTTMKRCLPRKRCAPKPPCVPVIIDLVVTPCAPPPCTITPG